MRPFVKNLAIAALLVWAISCAHEPATKREPYRTETTVEGTVVSATSKELRVRRFKDGEVVVIRVRSAEGIYIGDRVQVKNGEVRKLRPK